MDLVEALKVVHDLASAASAKADERSSERQNKLAAFHKNACDAVLSHIDIVMQARAINDHINDHLKANTLEALDDASRAKGIRNDLGDAIERDDPTPVSEIPPEDYSDAGVVDADAKIENTGELDEGSSHALPQEPDDTAAPDIVEPAKRRLW